MEYFTYKEKKQFTINQNIFFRKIFFIIIFFWWPTNNHECFIFWGKCQTVLVLTEIFTIRMENIIRYTKIFIDYRFLFLVVTYFSFRHVKDNTVLYYIHVKVRNIIVVRIEIIYLIWYCPVENEEENEQELQYHIDTLQFDHKLLMNVRTNTR